LCLCSNSNRGQPMNQTSPLQSCSQIYEESNELYSRFGLSLKRYKKGTIVQIK